MSAARSDFGIQLDLDRENARLENASPIDRLAFAVRTWSAQDLLFTSSFGAGSVVLLHMWSEVARDRPVVLLDTGFLFPETHAYKNELVKTLGLHVEIVRPPLTKEAFLAKHGADIYLSNSDFCCAENKVAPLAPYKDRAKAWISGLRRDQSQTRAHTRILERDPDSANGTIRVHPLATMTAANVAEYMHQHSLPEHPLRAKRFLSIGCAPCTRAVEPGEDERAGRWAGTAKTECGLHERRSAQR